MEDTTERLVSQQFEHCKLVYNAMEKNSFEEEIVDPNANIPTETIIVWEGFLTNLFGELSLATPYYTSVRRHLIRMGCVEQMRRGGGNSTSKWRLITPPTEDLFTASPAHGKSPAVTRLRRVEQEIRMMNTRVVKLEGLVTGLVEWVGEHGRNHPE